MPILTINDTDLAFEDEGTGSPLVFLPGLGGTSAMFEPQAAAFRATRRVIRLDLRGNGRSGRLDDPIGSVIDRQCDDLAALLDRLGLGRVVLIGVSYGGAIALRFAGRFPDRLDGLVVADAFAELRWTRPMEALLLLGSYLTLPAYFLPRPLLQAGLRHFFGPYPAALDAIPALVDHFRPAEAIRQSLAMCRIDEARHPGRIRCPTLGIVGGRYRTAVRLMDRAMATILGARLEVVPGAMDPSNLCLPEAFNRLLDGFLEEIDR
jgi:pimeloyl-ACP methyl ester carboxylesterase